MFVIALGLQSRRTPLCSGWLITWSCSTFLFFLQWGQYCSFYTCETKHDKSHTAGGHVRTTQHNSGTQQLWAGWIFLGPEPPDKMLDGLKFPARLLGDKQYPACVRRLRQTFLLPLNGHLCGSPQVPKRQKILCFTLNISHNKTWDQTQSYLGGTAQCFYLKLFYIKSNLYYFMIKSRCQSLKPRNLYTLNSQRTRYDLSRESRLFEKVWNWF